MKVHSTHSFRSPWSAVSASEALALLALMLSAGACAHTSPRAGVPPTRTASSSSRLSPALSDSAGQFMLAALHGSGPGLDLHAVGMDAVGDRKPDIDPIAHAVARYQETGTAEPVRVGNVLVLPFGHGQPTLTCAVLRVCVLELELGEAVVNDPIAGDHARWIIETARTGAGGQSTLVVVKPTACDITTNLVVSTDRRVYDLTLDARPCAKKSTNPKPDHTQPYTGHVRFYYPDEGEDREAGQGERSTAVVTDSVVEHGADSVTAPERALNRDYRIIRHRRGLLGLFRLAPLEFPWMPEAIWDDGVHVTLVLPAVAEHAAAPVLYALEDDGSRTIVNYTLRDGRIITDRTFRRGLLVLRSGAHEQRLAFENRAWGRPAAPDVSGNSGTSMGGR
jgi:type IV secretion system protein VirB9